MAEWKALQSFMQGNEWVVPGRSLELVPAQSVFLALGGFIEPVPPAKPQAPQPIQPPAPAESPKPNAKKPEKPAVQQNDTQPAANEEKKS